MSKIWLYWEKVVILQIEVRQTSFSQETENEFSISNLLTESQHVPFWN